MDLQLDTEIRSVLKLVRGSFLRTNETPLEKAIQELKRVTESAQNATDTNYSKRLLDEKLKRLGDFPDRKQFKEMKQQLNSHSKYLEGLETKSKKPRKRSIKLQSNKLPKHPQKPVIPARKGFTRRGANKKKTLNTDSRNLRLERTKRQLEKENVSALYETSRLRQELRKEKRALAKERSENARKSLEIDLLRSDNNNAYQNLDESKTALKEAQERCRELEASLQSQNEATQTAQDPYTGESPTTLDESFDEAGDLGDMLPSTPCSPVGNKSNEHVQNIATPPPSQKRRSSIRARAATPPETPAAGPSNSIILLADCFPVVEDENFDLETEEIMIDHLKSDRVFRRFKEFLKSGHENSWFCVEDIVKYGYSFGSWNDNICENGEHDGVRCRQVKVTVVDSTRHLCFKRDERACANSWQGWDGGEMGW
ncbi:hypothetical protein FVEG_04497 [Fusarium verticillioides 7600]|uniref:Uncharacterized protein n=1 Tax=Gibberella moniliformis (strain M3125 / FGSC 7600) TaxID=334819 RepID=W7LU61_GIBM7|nr:hypothetical protein FVEG_04497 [Fusarium verticillioides 7600]EWG42758.1 hypothetical protein FVEG_04497 [Fusarium verticillioides 7600]